MPGEQAGEAVLGALEWVFESRIFRNVAVVVCFAFLSLVGAFRYVIPKILYGVSVCVLGYWSVRVSPWFSYCRGSVYLLYASLYYPVRIAIALLIVQAYLYVDTRHAALSKFVQAVWKRLVVAAGFVVTIVLLNKGCTSLTAEFTAQKESWPEERQKILAAYLEAACGGEYEMFVGRLCSSFRGIWSAIVFLSGLALMCQGALTRNRQSENARNLDW